MHTAEALPLDTFLDSVTQSHEPALLIIEDKRRVTTVLDCLHARGVALASSYRGVLHHLALDVPVATLITPDFSDVDYNLIMQYKKRFGMIQIRDASSQECLTIHCNPAQARLLLICPLEDLRLIEQAYPLRSQFDLVETI